jgi:hypothetical protein
MEEERPLRLEPLGVDRRHTRYLRTGLGASYGDEAALNVFGRDLVVGDRASGRLLLEAPDGRR